MKLFCEGNFPNGLLVVQLFQYKNCSFFFNSFRGAGKSSFFNYPYLQRTKLICAIVRSKQTMPQYEKNWGVSLDAVKFKL